MEQQKKTMEECKNENSISRQFPWCRSWQTEHKARHGRLSFTKSGSESSSLMPKENRAERFQKIRMASQLRGHDPIQNEIALGDGMTWNGGYLSPFSGGTNFWNQADCTVVFFF